MDGWQVCQLVGWETRISIHCCRASGIALCLYIRAYYTTLLYKDTFIGHCFHGPDVLVLM